MIMSGATNDSEWEIEWQWPATNENEWDQIK